MIGMAESLVYAKRAGLDPHAVIAAIGSGAAGSWAVNNLGPRAVDRDFAPGFMIEHMAKDLGIALVRCRPAQKRNQQDMYGWSGQWGGDQ
jgi:3-hydroxyisobutyrate dehydrogenase